MCVTRISYGRYGELVSVEDSLYVLFCLRVDDDDGVKG
jgi:hypothetical protein